MQNLLNDLKAVLEKDDRLIAEGQLLKNKIIELALAMDAGLIRLLLTHDGIKKHFFAGVDNVLVFDKAKFQQFVSNKAFLPDSYTAFKNKIGLTADGQYLTDSKEVVLAWPYKDCVLEGGQTKEDAKRDEIFWNETLAPDQIDRLLAPKVLTNFKKYDKDGEHKVTGISQDDNLIIKGNNLLALHTVKAAYAGRVKLIYIDPPYNTETDSFQYNDKFNHSTWLTFMRNRLEVARDLLSHDGTIYVQLDYNEVHYCKVLMDEIFGRDNFQREVIWNISVLSGYKTMTRNWIRGHETLLFYSKSSEFHFNKLSTAHDQKYLDRFDKIDENGEHYFDGRGKKLLLKDVIEKGKSIGDVWRDIPVENEGIEDVWSDIMSFQQLPTSKEKLGFSTQKTEALLERVIRSATEEGDIVLDFFSGSGTTVATAHKLRRRWLAIEQIESQIEIALKRLQAVIAGDEAGISKSANWQGGGSFVYCELAQANQAYVARIQSATKTKDLQNIWAEMQDTAFLSYQIDPKTIDLKGQDFNALNLDDQKRFLIEVMDKNMLYVPFSEMDDETYGIGDSDKKLNRQFQGKA